MSQVPKRTRVRQLAGSVWPRREVDGYANLIATRLRKLAVTGSTGMLPVSGRGDGAIFFRGGYVVYAESSRTAARHAAVPDDPGMVPEQAGPPEAGTRLPAAPAVGRLAGLLALTEPTVDALMELLSSESRYAKFRQLEVPPVAQIRPVAVETLLAEVERRRRVLRQLAAVVTADTPVVRSASLTWSRLQISPPQWALVVRVGDGTTPRALALDLGLSVFATTIETYRLLALSLLAVPGRPASTAGRPTAVMSFLRAVSEER